MPCLTSNAQKITNNLLSDVLNAQIKTNGLLGAQNALTKKRISADKFSSQENAIEKFRQKRVGEKSKIKLPGKINWKNVLGLGALALGVGALVITLGLMAYQMVLLVLQIELMVLLTR